MNPENNKSATDLRIQTLEERMHNHDERLQSHSERLNSLEKVNIASDGRHERFTGALGSLEKTVEKIEKSNEESMQKIEILFENAIQTFKKEYVSKESFEAQIREGIYKTRLWSLLSALASAVLTFVILKVFEL